MEVEALGYAYINVFPDLTGGADLWECNECGALLRRVKLADHSLFHEELDDGTQPHR